MTPAAILGLAALLGQVVGPPAPPAETATMATPEASRKALERGIAYLVNDQNPDGSWGGPRNKTFTDSFANASTHDAWVVGTTGLVCTALLEQTLGPPAERALTRGLDYVIAHADVRRPAEWDVDNVWGVTYGLQAVARALSTTRSGLPDRQRLVAAGEKLLQGLERIQSPRGGWAYYAAPNAAWRPEWVTSFTTAVAVLALLDAKAAGLPVRDAVLRGAVRAIQGCRLPTGAYTYSLAAVASPEGLTRINQVKGSLSRIQVCNLALTRAGVTLPPDEMRRGVELFFQHHRFLDCGLRKPIPHEAYYQIAAYFYLFGHAYVADVIATLPPAARAQLWPRLRQEVVKTQESDGGFWDFYISSHTKPYGTAFSVLALGRSLRDA